MAFLRLETHPLQLDSCLRAHLLTTLIQVECALRISFGVIYLYWAARRLARLIVLIALTDRRATQDAPCEQRYGRKWRICPRRVPKLNKIRRLAKKQPERH